MRILHLFDLYLPNTMNWVHRLIQATPEVESWIAAPWLLHNGYQDPAFRYFAHPVQRWTHYYPSNEWQAEWFYKNLIRAERRWPVYRNWLYRQLKDHPPDLIHAHFGPVGCHYLPLAQKLDIPLLTSFYGYDYLRLPRQKPVYLERYKTLFTGGRGGATTGALTPKLLEALGCPSEKIFPVPVSIAPAEFPFIARRKMPGRLRLVQVATITEKKGHLDTLAALQIALRRCPQIQLSIVGERQDKKLYQQIQAFIQTHQLTQQVQLLDFLPHAQLPDFLGQFDVFIHPSFQTASGDCEGAPVAILEAMASGLPVISTEHSDIPMQVVHGQSGYLASERDPQQLAVYLEKFYHMDDETYQPMSHAARHQVAEHFEINQTAKRLRALYQSLIQPNSF